MRAKGTSGSVPGKHRGSGKSGTAGRAGSSASNRGKKEVPAWMADLPVQIGQQYEAEIIGISHDGEGVGRVNGFTLFVAGALPGERALVRVEHLKKQYGYAEFGGSDRSEPGSHCSRLWDL